MYVCVCKLVSFRRIRQPMELFPCANLWVRTVRLRPNYIDLLECTYRVQITGNTSPFICDGVAESISLGWVMRDHISKRISPFQMKSKRSVRSESLSEYEDETLFDRVYHDFKC